MNLGRGGDGVDRRTFLGTLGGVASVGIAGCFASDGDDGTSDGSGNDGGSDGNGGANEVAVGPGGTYAFDPETITVSIGSTVTWTWASANHNIVVETQPDAANWRGTKGDASTTYDDGHTYEYTFETTGTYEYYCQPHEGLGMRGTVVVEE